MNWNEVIILDKDYDPVYGSDQAYVDVPHSDVDAGSHRGAV